MTDRRTDSSAHRRLFLDGRLAGSSCLVGCAGIGPWRTSWQPRSRQPSACLSSSGMIRVEQKHHSTQSLDPCPGAICKTLHSNTRSSYDLQQGGVSRKKPRASIRGEFNKSHSVWERLWHKKNEAWGFIDYGVFKKSGKLAAYLLAKRTLSSQQ